MVYLGIMEPSPIEHIAPARNQAKLTIAGLTAEAVVHDTNVRIAAHRGVFDSLENGAKAGGVLAQLKALVEVDSPRGWGAYVDAKLPFNRMTAWKYMQLHEKAAELPALRLAMAGTVSIDAAVAILRKGDTEDEDTTTVEPWEQAGMQYKALTMVDLKRTYDYYLSTANTFAQDYKRKANLVRGFANKLAKGMPVKDDEYAEIAKIVHS